MPIDQTKLDELTNLVVDQMLREFRQAAKDDTKIDPRRLVAAQKLLESSNPRQLNAAPAPVNTATTSALDPDTGEVVELAPLDASTLAHAKSGRIWRLPWGDDKTMLPRLIAAGFNPPPGWKPTQLPPKPHSTTTRPETDE